MALADEFDGFLVDLDGVVWLGPEWVPGAAEALQELIEAGKGIVFVTNNPGRAPAGYAERLREAGVAVGEEQVVTAGEATARLAAEAAGPGGSVFVIGPATLKKMVIQASEASAVPFGRYGAKRNSGAVVVEGEAGREADVVLVAGHRGFDYEELLTAALALQRGAALFATSRDPTMPMPEGGWPGTGAVLAAVETASGARATIGGKPESPLFELALDRLNTLRCSLSRNSREKEQGSEEVGRVAMVGDRVSSDVVGGRRAGLETILVLSGATSRTAAESAEPRPDHVVDDLAGLLR
ncbi:MAG TPA: HAD-IIA family hydrolase [Solirubrobacterales bacterium]|nr:HAD-IIA family hydrolase [Solirubrobacterales bacterium]